MLAEITRRIGPVTLSTVALNGLGSTLSFLYTEIGPMVTFVGCNLSFLTGLLETTWKFHRETQQLLRDLSLKLALCETQLRELQASPYDLSESINSDFLRARARRMVTAVQRAQQRLVTPDRRFHSAAEFYRFAISMLNRLGPNDVVRVACTEHATAYSQSMPVRRWVVANFDAVKKGVTFHRTLIAPRTGVMLPVAVDQARKGLRVFLLSQSEVEMMSEIGKFPPDFGMAVVNSETCYYHWGAGETFEGCFATDPMLVAEMVSVMSTLETVADEVKPEPAA